MVQIKKKLDSGKTILYKLKLINSFRFISSKLSDLTDNLSEIYNEECRGCKERKKIKSVCNFTELKNNKLHYKCNECEKKRWLAPISKIMIISKFISLIQKGVYPYEYMDSWERFNEISLPDKKVFYSQLYLEDITNEDCKHAQKVFKEFNIK